MKEAVLPVVALLILVGWMIMTERVSNQKADNFYRRHFTAEQLEDLDRDPITGKKR